MQAQETPLAPYGSYDIHKVKQAITPTTQDYLEQLAVPFNATHARLMDRLSSLRAR